MKFETWNVSACAESQAKALEAAGYSPLTARVLCARGCHTPALAADYLRSDTPLCSPFLMKDMKTAADRVRLAVARKEHIAVFGDYDVDGITSTCLLTDFLRSLGARVTSYIPARLEEGYGLNETALQWLSRRQVNLVVTVDCGITADREAELCRKLGMDLVITDHHECKPTLPRAVAVVDPHRPDCGYPHTNLSGVGVAFQLASAICGDQQAMLERYADLLCLGLIADVMPLRGEVRTMVVKGLQALADPRRPGLRALMSECGVQPMHLDGIVDHLMNTDGVKAAVFLYETEPGVFKASLRSSDDVAVSEAAKAFGGGGHLHAAGCTLTMGAPEARCRLTAELAKLV